MAANGCEIRKRICLQQQHEPDRISELPDELLGEILSFIPDITDVVKTSVLSKRWKSVWTFVRVVEIRGYDSNPPIYPIMYDEQKEARFVDFVDNVFNHVSGLRKLDLTCYLVYVKKWIDIVTNKLDNHAASLHELDLTINYGPVFLNICNNGPLPRTYVKLHPSIFTSKVLVVLKLKFNVAQLTLLCGFSSSIPSTVWLPCLKVFHLIVEKYFIDVLSVQSFLAGCPVLEELHLSGNIFSKNSMRFCVKSSSLKRLKLCCFWYNSIIEIDASNLEELDLHLNLQGHNQIVIVNNSLPLLRRVTLAISFYQSPNLKPETHVVYGYRLIELLTKVSNTKYLLLSSDAMTCLENGGFYQQVPIFNNLIDLKLDVCFSTSCRILHWFLKSSRNLVSISICSVPLPSLTDQVHYQGTPKCSTMMRLHHLEKVEVKDFQGSHHEMKLVRYLLKNSPVLKEMIFSVPAHMKEVASELLGRLVKLPKASAACQITTL